MRPAGLYPSWQTGSAPAGKLGVAMETLPPRAAMPDLPERKPNILRLEHVAGDGSVETMLVTRRNAARLRDFLNKTLED